MKTVYRTYKFRMYPNAEQRQVLARYFGSVRFIYNHYLAERKRQYEETGKSDNYAKQAKDLVALHFICHLFGHIHSKNQYRCQKTDGSKMYDILMLGEHSLAAKGTALNKVFHDAGTINEISLSILEIDTSEHCIYRVSYGAYMNYDNSLSSVITKIPYRF